MNPGDQLDHYRVDSVVAHGGMASVFRGTDLRTNRPVAIKIPHPDVETDPVLAERFHREEEIGRSLDHPGVMKVLADDDRSKDYIVTEWFEGQPLRQILSEKKKLPADRVVRIIRGLCDALGYIHGHGIVHRDLRPENVMVDAQDHIKLFDFGIAAKAGSARLTFTNLSQIVGTSDYISPEELKGKRGDARSDLYAVGVILYEMLTEKTPFQGVDPFDRMRKNPVPPREIDPTISPQLQEVIYRALEREPKNRYANAHEVAHDLEHLDQVGVAERDELLDWSKKRAAWQKKALLYTAVALIPIVIFGLLLYFSSH